MLTYQHDRTCRMEMLQRDLDDTTAAPCGRCDNCAGPWFPTGVDSAATQTASGTLDKVGVEIEPRAQWPTGAERLGVEAKGKIAVDDRAETGRAVARLTDLGWGGVLRELFAAGAPDGPVTDELLGACVRVLKDWTWAERPVAVVSIPSRSRPLLVDSLARGIAGIGRLTDLGSLDLAGEGSRGGPGGNSAYRLADVWGQLAVGPELAAGLQGLGGKPVLLVDDRVDSRWTLTVAARELRRHGAGAVLPLVLGQIA